LGWRLGTWPGSKGDELLSFFDRQLEGASHLSGWDAEFRSFQRDCEFGVFWSLLWQMQVANYFSKFTEVKWNSKGPDIVVTTENGAFFVECYCPQRSYGMQTYISAVFDRIGSDIRVENALWLPFSLPQNCKRSSFLDELFSPYLTPKFLSEKRREALDVWPVLLPVPRGATGLDLFIEGPSDSYQPLVVDSTAGSPKAYFVDILGKAIHAKAKENDLQNHRPNLLAINFLLSAGYQMDSGRFDKLEVIHECSPPDVVDALMLSASGIDKELERNDFNVTHASKDHPIMSLLDG